MKLKAVFFLGLLIPMNVVGGWLFIQDSAQACVGGVCALLFFGAGGMWAFLRMIRHRGPTFELNSVGLCVRTVPGSMFIPWHDIDEIALYQPGRTAMPAIKLRSYHQTLESLTPEGIMFMSRGLRFLRIVSSSLPLVRTKDISNGFGSASPVATFLKWNRRKCGFELSFSTFQLDRSPEQFTNLLREYHRKYHAFNSADLHAAGH